MDFLTSHVVQEHRKHFDSLITILQIEVIKLIFISLQHLTIQQVDQNVTFTVWENHI